MAMRCVMVALAYLYLSAGVHFFSTWRTARHNSAQVTAMEHENQRLERRHADLGMRGTLEAEARRLGMMKRGEQAYVVSGLPNN
jgi:hypothetical protein